MPIERTHLALLAAALFPASHHEYESIWPAIGMFSGCLNQNAERVVGDATVAPNASSIKDCLRAVASSRANSGASKIVMCV